MNILLVIVDCLRYDTSFEMPFMVKTGLEGWWFSNHWATSHCTDPCVMNILSGRHPDDLRLWSMMYNRKKFTLPDTVKTFFHLAKEYRYNTCFETNLQRWYKRGVDLFIDSRGWAGRRVYDEAEKAVGSLAEPWLMVLHTDDMHTRYTGGSYKKAAQFTNNRLEKLYDTLNADNTLFLVTSDHGEGLGQAGPDGREIEQHGYGLWDFLTHIPLVVKLPNGFKSWGQRSEWLTDHSTTYNIIRTAILDGSLYEEDKDYVFQSGATPRFFHRGVVDREGRQFVRATMPDGTFRRYWTDCDDDVAKAGLELALKGHCEFFGLEYGETGGEAKVLEQLKGLGYWSEE